MASLGSVFIVLSWRGQDHAHLLWSGVLFQAHWSFGRIQFLTAIGLRFPFLCWLSAEDHSQTVRRHPYSLTHGHSILKTSNGESLSCQTTSWFVSLTSRPRVKVKSRCRGAKRRYLASWPRFKSRFLFFSGKINNIKRYLQASGIDPTERERLIGEKWGHW